MRWGKNRFDCGYLPYGLIEKMRLRDKFVKFYLKVMLFIPLVIFFQANMLFSFWPFEIKPDLLFLSVLVISLNSRPQESIAAAISCGLLKDIAGARFFGFNTLVFIIDSLIAANLCRFVYKEKLWINLVFISCLVLFNYLLLSIVSGRFYLPLGLIEIPPNLVFYLIIDKSYNFLFPKKDIFSCAYR